MAGGVRLVGLPIQLHLPQSVAPLGGHIALELLVGVVPGGVVEVAAPVLVHAQLLLQAGQLLLAVEGRTEIGPHVLAQGRLRLGQVVVRQPPLDRHGIRTAALALHQMLAEAVAEGPDRGQQVRL